MRRFEYTFNSINKSLTWALPEKFYNTEEVVTVLKSIATTIDHILYEQYEVKEKTI